MTRDGAPIRIRPESQRDVAAVRAVNRAAFETDTESNLVDALWSQAEEFISLVAEQEGSIVGHIFFSPVTLLGHERLKIMGLAPMAVLPAKQRMGIGSSLVREGLNQCRRIGFAAVIVLGHSEYYPRFGFVPASRFGIRSEYDVPDEVFMAIELKSGALSNRRGIIRYHPAFGSV